MITRSTMLLGAMLAIVAVASGCGGDDDSGTASAVPSSDGGTTTSSITTSSLNRNQFVNQANAACAREKSDYAKEAQASVEKLRAEGVSAHQTVVGTLQAVIPPITEAQLDAVYALGAPAGDEAEVEAALNAQREANEEFRTATPSEIGSLPRKYFEDATEKLESYGLYECTVDI